MTDSDDDGHIIQSNDKSSMETMNTGANDSSTYTVCQEVPTMTTFPSSDHHRTVETHPVSMPTTNINENNNYHGMNYHGHHHHNNRRVGYAITNSSLSRNRQTSSHHHHQINGNMTLNEFQSATSHPNAINAAMFPQHAFSNLNHIGPSAATGMCYHHHLPVYVQQSNNVQLGNVEQQNASMINQLTYAVSAAAAAQAGVIPTSGSFQAGDPPYLFYDGKYYSLLPASLLPTAHSIAANAGFYYPGSVGGVPPTSVGASYGNSFQNSRYAMHNGNENRHPVEFQLSAANVNGTMCDGSIRRVGGDVVERCERAVQVCAENDLNNSSLVPDSIQDQFATNDVDESTDQTSGCGDHRKDVPNHCLYDTAEVSLDDNSKSTSFWLSSSPEDTSVNKNNNNITSMMEQVVIDDDALANKKVQKSLADNVVNEVSRFPSISSSRDMNSMLNDETMWMDHEHEDNDGDLIDGHQNGCTVINTIVVNHQSNIEPCGEYNSDHKFSNFDDFNCISQQNNNDVSSNTCIENDRSVDIITPARQQMGSASTIRHHVKSWASLFRGSSSSQSQDASHETRNMTIADNHVSGPDEPMPPPSPLSSSAAVITTLADKQSSSATHVTADAVESDHSVIPKTKQRFAENSYPICKDTFTKLSGVLYGYTPRQSAPALTPRGLCNGGNWCYINAVLQALLACPMFYNFIDSLPSPDYHGLHAQQQEGTREICDGVSNQADAETRQQKPKTYPLYLLMIKKLFRNFSPMHRTGGVGGRGPITHRRSTPADLTIGEPLKIDELHKLSSQLFSNRHAGGQEDAHEFLNLLLSKLQSECSSCMNLSKEKTDTQRTAPDHRGLDDIEEDDDGAEWQEYYGRRVHLHREVHVETTPVAEIFGGCFRTTIDRQGMTSSSNMEPFHFISLDPEYPSLPLALKSLNAKTPIHGMSNPTTKKSVKALQTMLIEKLPPCLIIHLKCFSWTKTNGFKKIMHRMPVPVDFSLPPEVLSRSLHQSMPRSYKLFAVVHHRGPSVHNGHYICDVFHPGLPGWVRCDDDRVNVVSSRHVLASGRDDGNSEKSELTPFLLFYRENIQN